MIGALFGPVVVAALAAASPALEAAAEPVAVLRFKDLSGDQRLAWLSAGLQETMTTDLRGAGVVVVERGRVDAASKELRTAADDVRGAVDVGKLVGAKTLVIGSYQQQGDALRLVARFVDVATGEVKSASKATGPSSSVFALQDELVEAWLPAPKKKKKKPQPAPTPQRLAAYQKLGEALSSSSPAAAQALLTQALTLDPTFSYASSSMAALTARVDAALDQGVAVALDDAAGLAAVATGSGTVDGRVAAGKKALDLLARAHCFHALRATAEALLATPSLAPLFEEASSARVTALWRLRQSDLTLQAGEKHLQQFAGGAATDVVRAAVRDVAEQRRTLPERERAYAEDAADDDAFRPCIAAKWALLPDRMERNCRAYVDAHAADADVDVKDHVRAARVYVAWSFALRGDFARAWQSARAVDVVDPGALDDVGLRPIMDDTWSRDR